MPTPPPPSPKNAVITNANDLIRSSLRLIGAIAPGEQPAPDEAGDGLIVFNEMVDSWNADRLAIFTTRIDDFPLIAGKQSYTLGTGGDFDMTRPPQIDSMSVILLNNPNNPVEIPLAMYTVDDWQNDIPVKNVDSTFPLGCYDDGGFPLRTLNFWPIPQQVNNARIYSWQPLQLATSLQAQVMLPPGYAEAFRYNLAIRLAPEYAVAVPASVATIAVESLARVKTMNAPELTLRSDLLASPSGYNYKADLFGIGW